jgi:hypothetical protein
VNLKPVPGDGRSPSLALVLSFLWPGLGQLYQGRRRTALLYAIPVLIAAFLIVLQLVGGLERFIASMLDPTVALTLVILIGLLGAWRLISMGDAILAPRAGRPVRRRVVYPLFAVLAGVVVMAHLWVGSVSWAFYEAGTEIFVGERGPDATPIIGDASPNPSDNEVDFQATPFPTPPTTSKRITILVTGIDSGHGRDHALTDTIMLVSVDPNTGKVAMLSFPRDISNFELYDGGVYHGKINSLMTYARLHPQQFPDGGRTS